MLGHSVSAILMTSGSGTDTPMTAASTNRRAFTPIIGPTSRPAPKEGAWLAVCVGVLGSNMRTAQTHCLRMD